MKPVKKRLSLSLLIRQMSRAKKVTVDKSWKMRLKKQ